MSLFRELKRRNVLRVGAAYVVAAWLVVQVVETIFPAFGFGDAAVRIVTIVFAIGLLPALIFAWAFELTPEGLKKESEVDRSQSITPHTGKKLDRMIMLVLALASGYFAFDKFVLNPQREAELAQQSTAAVEQARQEGRTEALVESFGDQSIAVLAFDDMSQDGDQEYLSDGIAEELLNLLAKIPDLRVISRSSAFSYKGKDIKLAQLAEELNVAHILEGSVRKAGNRVRITTQLIDARSDTHLWSETYDRSLDDVFAIQDDIASHVVEELKLQLLGETPTSKRTDPEAYALVLQANQMTGVMTPESLKGAIEKLNRALELDPGYARAWVKLSVAYDTLGVLGIMPAEQSKAESLKAVRRALEIDPNDVSALSAMGHRFNDRGDKNMAAYHFQRAYTLDPGSSQVIGDVSIFLKSLG
jgi:TolB-like protein